MLNRCLFLYFCVWSVCPWVPTTLPFGFENDDRVILCNIYIVFFFSFFSPKHFFRSCFVVCLCFWHFGQIRWQSRSTLLSAWDTCTSSSGMTLPPLYEAQEAPNTRCSAWASLQSIERLSMLLSVPSVISVRCWGVSEVLEAPTLPFTCSKCPSVCLYLNCSNSKHS